MNIERLRKILTFSEKKREETTAKIRRFCAYADIDPDTDVLNVLQIVRASLKKRGFWIMEMPFADDEIGALCYKGDGLGYIVINTSLPIVNSNFAIAHEIYHVLFQESEFVSKVEFSDDRYYEHEEEFAANLFAGMLLMPEMSFRRMYTKFKEESNGVEFDTVIRLMAYYQVPYMSVLIRCYELDLLQNTEVTSDLLAVTEDSIKEKFDELWLDNSILLPSKKDDYLHMERAVQIIGEEYIEDGYINNRTLKKVLQNMQALYRQIKGE